MRARTVQRSIECRIRLEVADVRDVVPYYAVECRFRVAKSTFWDRLNWAPKLHASPRAVLKTDGQQLIVEFLLRFSDAAISLMRGYLLEAAEIVFENSDESQPSKS